MGAFKYSPDLPLFNFKRLKLKVYVSISSRLSNNKYIQSRMELFKSDNSELKELK
jgi:hypothetical protein